MLSRGTLATIGFVLKTCFRFGTLPYEWNSKSMSLVTTSSKIKLIHWHAAIILCCLNAIFIGVRLVQGSCCLGVSIGQTFLNFYLWVCWSTAALFNLNTLRFREEVAKLVNELFRTSRVFQDIFMPNADLEKWRDKCEKPMRAIVSLSYAYCLSQIFAFLALSRNPTYVYSIFGEKGDPLWQLLPWGLNEAFLAITGAQVIIFYVIIYQAYVTSLLSCLDRIRFQDTVDTIVDGEKFCILYRHLQMSNIIYNATYKKMIQPILTCWLLLVNVTSNYAAFKLYDEMGMPAFLAVPFMSTITISMALVVYPSSFRIRVLSQDIIHSWKQQNNSQLVRIFLRSCPPLGIQVGEFYIIKRVTVSSFFQCAIDYTVTLLLTF